MDGSHNNENITDADFGGADRLSILQQSTPPKSASLLLHQASAFKGNDIIQDLFQRMFRRPADGIV